jgi:hypothetical protein
MSDCSTVLVQYMAAAWLKNAFAGSLGALVLGLFLILLP